MTDLLDSSQIQQVAVTVVSAILAWATPTEGFLLALVIAFGFNIFAILHLFLRKILKNRFYAHILRPNFVRLINKYTKEYR